LIVGDIWPARPSIAPAAIRTAWRDPSIGALVAVRGGYGSVQVLPLLDREEARRAAKPFVGYSDLTAVLTFLTDRLRAGRVSRTDAGRPLRAGRRGLRRESFLSACAGVSRSASSRRRRSTRSSGRGERDAARRDAHAAAGVARDAVRVRAAARFVLFLEEVGERPYRSIAW
jgi:muramoyltetrapeptide carboxypeptidase